MAADVPILHHSRSSQMLTVFHNHGSENIKTKYISACNLIASSYKYSKTFADGD